MNARAHSKAICHSYYVLFGMVGIGLLPALIKSFEDSYGISHGTMGLVLGISAVVMALGSLVGGAWYDRRGAHPPLSATMALCAVSAVGIYLSPAAMPFVLWLMVFHVANGLGAVVNPLVGELYEEERTKGISLLHAFQGVGRLLAPMLVAACIWATGQWRTSLAVSAALFAVWFLVVWLGLREPARAADSLSEESAASPESVNVLREPALLSALAGFVVLSGCELTLITWLPNFLESEAGFPKTVALAALTFMMIGYTAIRAFLGLGRHRVSPGHIGLSVLLLTTSLLLIMHVHDHRLLYGLAFLLGLSFGPYWPSLAAAIYDYTPHGHGKLTGLFGVGSTAGAFLFVSAVGIAGDIVGLKYGLLVSPACAGVFAIIYATFTITARRKRLQATDSADDTPLA